MNIRAYKDTDFDEICSWWKDQGECPPLPGMMTSQGTFVLEYEGTPVMTLSCMRTQSPEISYFEGYCAKPGLKKEVRNALGDLLWQHGYQYLRSHGFKRVLTFTNKETLLGRYQKLGMIKCMSGVYALGRVL